MSKIIIELNDETKTATVKANTDDTFEFMIAIKSLFRAIADLDEEEIALPIGAFVSMMID